MRKRITSLLLTLVMLLSLVPAMGVTASAAETWKTVNTYKELQEAVTAKQEYIKLGQNIDTTNLYYPGSGINAADWLTFRGQTCTLDLNGNTLTFLGKQKTLVTFMRVYEGSNLTIKDSQGGGKIIGSFKDFKDEFCLIHANKSSLTLEGGTLEVSSDPYKYSDVIRSTEGSVTVKKGVKLVAPEYLGESGYALNANTYTGESECGRINISGGEFDGYVSLVGSKSTTSNEPTVKISDGVFKKNVSLGYRTGTNFHATYSPVVEVSGGTFYGNVDAGDWRAVLKKTGANAYDVQTQGYMPLRLIGGTFYNKLDLHKQEFDTPYYSDTVFYCVSAAVSTSIENSAIVIQGDAYTSADIYNYLKPTINKGAAYVTIPLVLQGTSSSPVKIIPNAWGMKSVTLDGTKTINYAKDWKGAVEKMDNSTAHTLKFEWYPLAQELKDAGYTYRANFDGYTVGSNTPTTSVPISATATEYSHTIPAGAAPSVYPFDLQLNLDKNGSSVGIIVNQHIVKLMVSEAPPAPPAPVAHSITITNTHGTATPSTAIAGETVTVKADDRTGYSQMFTQWYTKTAGVTFADVTEQETTFTMPDCDVQVYPGYQYVSFTKQPIDSWPQVNHGSKATVTFSAPITKWELKEGNTTVASSGSLFINTGNPITVDIPAQSSKVEKTYTVVVTANGQKFSSDEFKVKWVSWPQAPAVEFTPADGTQFVGEIDVTVSDALYAGEEIFEIAYTTDGTDPKTSTTTIYANTDTKHITLTETTTTIKARTYNRDAAEDAEKWGPLATATYTKYSDSTLPKPTITPEGTTYTGSIKAYLTAPALDGVKLEYQLVSPGEELVSNQWHDYNPEIGIDVYEFGTVTLYARSIKEVDMGDHVEQLTSENATATYTRTYSAAIDNVTVSGKVGETLTQDVVIRMNGDRFENVNVTAGEDVSDWFNLPVGLTAKVKALSEADGYHENLTVTISGMPKATSAAAITVTIPKDKLYANNTADLTVLSNPNAYYSIALDADHQHDYTGQPYLYLDPGNHYQECTAGDGYNIQAHEFTPWTDNGTGTHSRHCTVCKKSGEAGFYTETAEHNWQWVVDDAATPNAAGKQHEECVDCHAKRNENTPIPMLTSIMVENLTVAKPVKDGVATAPTTTDSTYYVANTEWTAADGTTLAIGDKFQPGTVYTVKITLETTGAGVFSVNSSYNTIEGKAATVSPKLTGNDYADSVELTYTFDKTAGGYHPGTGTGTGATTYPITVKSAKNGDVTASHKSAAKGTTVTLTVDPDKGYVLDTLTVLDGKDKEIKLTEKNGKYTFTMPDSKVTVAATFKASAPTGKNPFIDVPAGSYYEDAVVWAVEKGITSGTSAVTFDPNGNCTRAQAVTFLWRAAGSPAPKTKVMPFTDVPSGSYYYDAVLWAMEQGITKGTSDTAFSPNASCTRAQIVTFLWRANGSPAVSGNSAFTDVAADAYYAAAVTWAEKNDVTGGIGGGLFGSNSNCTRAQIVTFLYRAMK